MNHSLQRNSSLKSCIRPVRTPSENFLGCGCADAAGLGPVCTPVDSAPEDVLADLCTVQALLDKGLCCKQGHSQGQQLHRSPALGLRLGYGHLGQQGQPQGNLQNTTVSLKQSAPFPAALGVQVDGPSNKLKQPHVCVPSIAVTYNRSRTSIRNITYSQVRPASGYQAALLSVLFRGHSSKTHIQPKQSWTKGALPTLK